MVIMAGGKSSRFGGNKALAPWKNNATIIENIIETAQQVSSKVALSVRDSADYPQVRLPRFPDILKDRGPLGGLHSALFHCQTQWVMLLACDMPLVDLQLLRYMVEIETWAPLIIPCWQGRFEPLHAIYHRSLLPLVENLVEKNRLRMRELTDKVPKFLVMEEDIIRITGSLKCLSNVNTPAEFEKARELAGRNDG